MKYLVVAIFLGFFGLAFPALAQTPTNSCQPIFGGGDTCTTKGNLIINKTIQQPGANTFVDGLNPTAAFTPSQNVTFRITITNNNNSALNNVTITDYFSRYLTFTKGPGTFDTQKRTLEIKEARLNGNETKTYSINARVEGAGVFPTDRPVTCLANQAEVKAGNRTSTDNVQFCIRTGTQQVASAATQQPSLPSLTTTTPTPASRTTPNTSQPNTTKGGVTVYPAPQSTQSPNTGPELLALIGLIPAGVTGLYLRRRSA